MRYVTRLNPVRTHTKSPVQLKPPLDTNCNNAQTISTSSQIKATDMPKRGGKVRRKRPNKDQNDRDSRQPKQAPPPNGNYFHFDWAGICGSG